MELSNRIVATGASAGIDLAIAQQFASAEWATGTTRDPDRLEPARQLVEPSGANRPAPIDGPSKARVAGSAKKYVARREFRVVEATLARGSLIAGLSAITRATASVRRLTR